MKKVEDYETIRRAYFVDKLSIRAINRRFGYHRDTIRKAIVNPAPQPYMLKKPRDAPVIGPYKQRIAELLEKSKKQPRKQRYTAYRIYEILVGEGYQGSAGSVLNYVSQQRRKRKRRDTYLPLEFDPGQDAQVDWGEAEVEMVGKRVAVQVFVMRLNYSRVRFAMAFPFQKQEAFFDGHVQAFHFFGGVIRRITYDNLKTAVYKVLEGKNRVEQEAFKTLRSHYLFESNYCNRGQGHEKGGVESDVGYAQRNFLTPILQVNSFEELNYLLHKACLQDVQRHVRGKEAPVAELWEEEKADFIPLPANDFAVCTTHLVKPNPYSQVEFETNRYSVPVTQRNSQLVLQAYPFRVRILSDREVVADHPRCLGREQDVIEPLHYLTLLEQRPGAFEHAIPVRRWRKYWPKDYDLLLEELRDRFPEGRGVREFIAILKLHQDYPAKLVEQAVHRAIELNATHLDGVKLCLRQLQEEETATPSLDLSEHPHLANFGRQPLDLHQYDLLLAEV
jgi:transposase